eukprot:TRINITY_DN592_c0_g1_i1.p1 TRINITY_DN592_c0_g1~~TRINITY_DN592_c0_g1_i1.p1  ORF type:complete len:119 (-),score=24.70 TRINITY_DN592_c0_g1_i1:61-417(-)
MADNKVTSKDLDDVAKAIEEDDYSCPCIQKIKEGPCGDEFMGAFKCYLKSTEAEKGSDCLDYFKAMKECMDTHPEAFADDEEETSTENQPASESVQQEEQQQPAAATTEEAPNQQKEN